MHLKIKLSVLLVLCWGVSFAGGGVYYGKMHQYITVDSKHAEFVVKLKSNPTTGYSWVLRSYDHKLLVPVAHHYQASSSGLMGAPGEELWTFRLQPAAFVTPHQLTIQFVSARPWQPVASNNQTVIVHVTTVVK